MEALLLPYWGQLGWVLVLILNHMRVGLFDYVRIFDSPVVCLLYYHLNFFSFFDMHYGIKL